MHKKSKLVGFLVLWVIAAVVMFCRQSVDRRSDVIGSRSWVSSWPLQSYGLPPSFSHWRSHQSHSIVCNSLTLLLLSPTQLHGHFSPEHKTRLVFESAMNSTHASFHLHTVEGTARTNLFHTTHVRQQSGTNTSNTAHQVLLVLSQLSWCLACTHGVTTLSYASSAPIHALGALAAQQLFAGNGSLANLDQLCAKTLRCKIGPDPQHSCLQDCTSSCDASENPPCSKCGEVCAVAPCLCGAATTAVVGHQCLLVRPTCKDLNCWPGLLPHSQQ